MIFNLAIGVPSDIQSVDRFGKSYNSYLMASGTGTLTVEIKGEDGVFRSFPETTLSCPIATSLELPNGDFRLTATVGALIVEIRL
jgi:hypothetical protein